MAVIVYPALSLKLIICVGKVILCKLAASFGNRCVTIKKTMMQYTDTKHIWVLSSVDSVLHSNHSLMLSSVDSTTHTVIVGSILNASYICYLH